MLNIDLNKIGVDDLKDNRALVKSFKKFLKKKCKYSTEEANFAAEIIDNPFSKHFTANKKIERTIILDGTEYEVIYFSVKDCAPELFEFYTLVDKSTLNLEMDEQYRYYFAHKMYILGE